jgi:hypothetical protein
MTIQEMARLRCASARQSSFSALFAIIFRAMHIEDWPAESKFGATRENEDWWSLGGSNS